METHNKQSLETRSLRILTSDLYPSHCVSNNGCGCYSLLSQTTADHCWIKKNGDLLFKRLAKHKSAFTCLDMQWTLKEINPIQSILNDFVVAMFEEHVAKYMYDLCL